MSVLTQESIPLVDLRAQFAALRSEVMAAIEEVATRASFIKGPYVATFEREFADFSQAPFCVGVANGTEALFLALKALGVSPGDEIITVPNTFTATAEAIVHAGAIPRFVDVEPGDHLIDPAAVEAAIGPRTAGIIPVHLFGQPAQMERLQAIAARHSLFLLEDAAQAHGASEGGRPVGTLGQLTTFSFYPGKNLGAYGDAGAVITHDEQLDRKVRMLADHGRLDKYLHEMVGYGCRLDALQAAVLSVKLRYLPEWNARRRELARRYDELLAAVPAVQPLETRPDAVAAYYVYVVEVEARDRDSLQQWLGERGIATGIYYPIPLHLQPAYAHLGYQAGDFPVAEAKAERILSLPLYPELTSDQQDRVVQAIRDYVSSYGHPSSF